MSDEIRCEQCSLGIVSGVGRGQFCPFIVRDYKAGDVLYRAGDAASYIWFVKSGVVEIRAAGEHTAAETAPGESAAEVTRKSQGSFVGLEALVRDHYDANAVFASDATLCGATRAGFGQWLGPRAERTCLVLRDLMEEPVK